MKKKEFKEIKLSNDEPIQLDKVGKLSPEELKKELEKEEEA